MPPEKNMVKIIRENSSFLPGQRRLEKAYAVITSMVMAYSVPKKVMKMVLT